MTMPQSRQLAAIMPIRRSPYNNCTSAIGMIIIGMKADSPAFRIL